jgi:phosphatidylethanolamine/phosphatidyl-N-methylethanolamine N-methyltransferase
MTETPAHRARSPFSEGVGFLRAWMNGPQTVGSVWPTGAPMARRMASVIDVNSGLPVLEIGPGTGTITKAILDTGLAPDKVFAVEYSQDFVDKLRIKFPGINVVRGDAFNLTETLADENQTKFDCAISALPLLNFPPEARIAFVDDVLNRIPTGRPLIQFSYGPKAPVAAKSGKFSLERYDFVLRNIPPAQLWIYRRII